MAVRHGAEPQTADVTRYLRPARILRSTYATWLVDESWSVAARLGDDGGVELLSWPWWGASVDPDHRVVVADGVGIVVWSRGRVAWVRAEGTTLAEVDDEMRLAAVDPELAWLVDRSYVNPGDPPAPPPLSPRRIVTMRHGAVGVRDRSP